MQNTRSKYFLLLCKAAQAEDRGPLRENRLLAQHKYMVNTLFDFMGICNAAVTSQVASID